MSVINILIKIEDKFFFKKLNILLKIIKSLQEELFSVLESLIKKSPMSFVLEVDMKQNYLIKKRMHE